MRFSGLCHFAQGLFEKGVIDWVKGLHSLSMYMYLCVLRPIFIIFLGFSVLYQVTGLEESYCPLPSKQKCLICSSFPLDLDHRSTSLIIDKEVRLLKAAYCSFSFSQSHSSLLSFQSRRSPPSFTSKRCLPLLLLQSQSDSYKINKITPLVSFSCKVARSSQKSY